MANLKWSFLLVTLFMVSVSAAPEGDVIQLVTDVSHPEQAWMLTKKGLFYNANAQKGGAWELRFDSNTFSRLTGSSVDTPIQYVKVLPSKKEPGTVLLGLEVGAEKKRVALQGKDFGKVWRQLQLPASPPAAPAVAPETASAPKVSRPEEGAIDLEELNANPVGASVASAGAVSTTTVPPPPSYVAPTTSGAGPMFKFMFDFWLYSRPGVTPITFSNVHTLALVEVAPVADLLFGFELAPTPRYYEVTYKLGSRWEIRGGRIWVPFDTISTYSPHNLFGGLVNVSQFRQIGGSAFLPDIWTDLGIAAKYRIVDSGALRWDLQMYMVNGFQSGGSDPGGLAGTRYPNFESAGVIDNNSEKSFGLRSTTLFFGFLNLGLSAYFGRYTDPTDTPAGILMLGADAQLRLRSGFELKAGYLFSEVGLVPEAGRSSFRRGGLYAEASQKLGPRFKLFARGGTAQNDDRVLSVNDITMVGAGLIYFRDFIQLSFMYQRDLNQVVAKRSYDFTALRAMVVF